MAHPRSDPTQFMDARKQADTMDEDGTTEMDIQEDLNEEFVIESMTASELRAYIDQQVNMRIHNKLDAFIEIAVGDRIYALENEYNRRLSTLEDGYNKRLADLEDNLSRSNTSHIKNLESMFTDINSDIVPRISSLETSEAIIRNSVDDFATSVQDKREEGKKLVKRMFKLKPSHPTKAVLRYNRAMDSLEFTDRIDKAQTAHHELLSSQIQDYSSDLSGLKSRVRDLEKAPNAIQRDSGAHRTGVRRQGESLGRREQYSSGHSQASDSLRLSY